MHKILFFTHSIRAETRKSDHVLYSSSLQILNVIWIVKKIFNCIKWNWNLTAILRNYAIFFMPQVLLFSLEKMQIRFISVHVNDCQDVVLFTKSIRLLCTKLLNVKASWMTITLKQWVKSPTRLLVKKIQKPGAVITALTFLWAWREDGNHLAVEQHKQSFRDEHINQNRTFTCFCWKSYFWKDCYL